MKNGISPKKLTIVLFVTLLSFSYANANTVFIYRGNEYNDCQGSYCTGGPYALSIVFVTTMDGNALADLPFTDIASTITSFAFNDGSGLSVNQDTDGGYGSFQVSTDATGEIITWLVGAYANQNETQMQTNWNTQYSFQPGADFSETSVSFSGDYGMISGSPGTWTKVPVYCDVNGDGKIGLAEAIDVLQTLSGK